jgi:hypothetical protein
MDCRVDCRKNFGLSRGRKLWQMMWFEMRYVRSPILGHASERTTLAIYAHSMRRRQDRKSVIISVGSAPTRTVRARGRLWLKMAENIMDGFEITQKRLGISAVSFLTFPELPAVDAARVDGGAKVARGVDISL